MLAQRERDFVDAQRVGHLATADAEGNPHVVPVCFVISNDTIYVKIVF